jgi:hypothetical protein
MNSRKVKIDAEAEKKELLTKPKGSVRVRINVDGEDKGAFEVLKTLDFNGNVSQLVFVQE